MWTPRRIVLLAVGLAVFGAAFVVYNRFLGWIDGLPALPERYLPSAVATALIFDQLPPDNKTERMIRQAFGDGCPELNYPIKVREAQGLVLATDDAQIEPDGRLKLAPFSLASFGKDTAGFPEINTIHCDVAYVEFDRPIASLSDITRGKMVAAEFVATADALTADPRKGRIHIRHNHATAAADDDVVTVTPGPIFFRDTAATQPDRPQLWTKAFVDITDYQARPPHIIKAQGMNVYLAADALQTDRKAAPKPADPNKPNQPVRAVELLVVNMALTLEDDGGLGGPGDPKQPRLAPDDKPRLTINTQGKFHFDLQTDRAYFDVPPPTGSALPQYVDVMRLSKANGNDQVQCDRLDLQFGRRRPAGPSPAAAPPRAGPLEIDEVKATGSLVILTSDAEKLHARGTELVYSKSRQQSVLRGAPMSAVKEGHKIEAAELVLHQADKALPKPGQGPVRQADAQGPGTIWLLDRDNQRTVEVSWTDRLLLDKDGPTDRLTLTGGAAFTDRERDQYLRGGQIKLWLAPDAGAPPPKPGPTPLAAAAPGARSKPQRLHVIGQVEAKSPEMRVNNTDLLIVWFTDLPTLPAAPAAVVSRSAPVGPAAPPAVPAAPVATAPAPAAPKPAEPPKRPFVISARVVEAFVTRAGPKNDLDRVKCFERVVVHQDAEKAGERGLDMTSQTLELTRTPDGDILKLTGPLARVDTQELSLVGPQIVFNQKENRARVDGAGAMRMVTATTLKGEKKAKPAEVHVYWNEKMNLTGAFASFIGGVQAVQDDARVQCPRMDVYLDRPVALRRAAQDRTGPTPVRPASTMAAGGGKDDSDKPKVVKVICHRDGLLNAPPVTITEAGFEKGRLVRYRRIESPEVTFDNAEGKLKAAGRGEVRLLQLGEKSADPFAGKPADRPAGPPVQEMQLTRVRFEDRMEANDKIQTASFYKRVEVAHLPADNPNLVIDESKLLPGMFTMHCDVLQVTQKEDQGKTYPSMVAEGHADVTAREFSGRADVVKYDEGADKNQRIIFESTSSQPALLSRADAPGARPQDLQGKVIYYWRKTNAFQVKEAYFLDGISR